MSLLLNYILFIAKTLSFLVLVFIFVVALLSLAMKGKQKSADKLSIKKLNKQFEATRLRLLQATASKAQLKQLKKQQKTKKKTKDKEAIKPRLFVIDFHGDIQAKATKGLTQQINAIILAHQEGDEVLLRLESPGGVVPGYGLAAAQLIRLKQKKHSANHCSRQDCCQRWLSYGSSG